jgi:probable HAF family extracellular repeat protein
MRYVARSKQFLFPLLFLFALCAVLAVTAGAGPLSAQSGSYHLVQVPNSGLTAANGINKSGQIVGFYVSNTQNQILGYLFSGGKYTTISYGDNLVEVNGINDSGVMVGFYGATTAGPFYGFILDHGVFTTISYPGATQYTIPEAINNKGEVVGNWSDENGTQYLFKYVDGVFTDVSITGATRTVGVGGVNDNGDISGFYGNNGGNYGFVLHSDGELQTIEDPNDPTVTGLAGLNNKGQAVGNWYNNNTQETKGFLWSDGKFKNVNYPGASSTYPLGVTDSGMIVGCWFISSFDSSQEEGFYYIP